MSQCCYARWVSPLWPGKGPEHGPHLSRDVPIDRRALAIPVLVGKGPVLNCNRLLRSSFVPARLNCKIKQLTGDLFIWAHLAFHSVTSSNQNLTSCQRQTRANTTCTRCRQWHRPSADQKACIQDVVAQTKRKESADQAQTNGSLMLSGWPPF